MDNRQRLGYKLWEGGARQGKAQHMRRAFFCPQMTEPDDRTGRTVYDARARPGLLKPDPARAYEMARRSAEKKPGAKEIAK